MPLIRYRVGDRGALPPAGTSCPCGRTLPLLAGVEGRVDDVLFTADGRRVGRLDPVFKANLPLREAQVVQEALDSVRVRYVPALGFTPDAGRLIVDGIQARMGAVRVVLEEVPEVPRTVNGKFRAVVCNLTAAEKEAASRGPGLVETEEHAG
jgi:phenylacetate-CoA ligase